MQKLHWLWRALILLTSVGVVAQTPTPMTWEQVRQRFQQSNPTLLAAKLNIDESGARKLRRISAPIRISARVLTRWFYFRPSLRSNQARRYTVRSETLPLGEYELPA